MRNQIECLLLSHNLPGTWVVRKLLNLKKNQIIFVQLKDAKLGQVGCQKSSFTEEIQTEQCLVNIVK